MRAAIHQSQYLPWPPYFKKIAAADIFVVMDRVQYQKNGMQNRNQIRNQAGAFWLTIPVTGHLEDTIMDKRPVDDRWRQKHWKSIAGAYSKAPFWNAYAPELEQIYGRPHQTLGSINDALMNFFLGRLKIETKIVPLSSLDVPGAASALVLGICRALQAGVYVSGTGAKDYIDEGAFAAAGVRLDYLESVPPTYPQFQGGAFVPGLSMLDMMLNVGDDGVRAYLHG